MTTSTIQILSSELEGKDVNISLVGEDDGDIEGRVIKANEKAVVIKSGSKSRLIERHEILDIEVIDRSKPKKIVVRWIADVTPDNVRQHLADRHGMPVDLIPIDTQAAIERHGLIDHERLRLGHRHGVKPKRQRRSMSATPEEVANRAQLLGVAEGSSVDDFAEGDEDDD